MVEINNILGENNPYYILTISFGKKDFDLCNWVSSIPKGQFSYYVRQSIKAFIDKDMSFKLPKFPMKNSSRKNFTKSLAISKEEDLDVYNYLLTLEASMVSFSIKQILRKYLASNKDSVSNVVIEENKLPKDSVLTDSETPLIVDINTKSIIPTSPKIDPMIYYQGRNRHTSR